MCIGEKKAADQLCSNCTADQPLCFRYTDSSTIPRILKSKSSSFWPVSETVQASLCQTWSENKIVGFLMMWLITIIFLAQIAQNFDQSALNRMIL